MDIAVIRNIVAVIFSRRRVKWKQPDGGNPEVFKVIEFFHQSSEVPHTVRVDVFERLHMELINDRILVPVRIVFQFLEIFGHSGALT